MVAFFVFVAIVAAGVPVIIKGAKPTYFAESTIYVSPTFDNTLKDAREQRPQFNIQQQMLMISRYDVVYQTIRELWTKGVDVREAGETDQKAAERLVKEFEVTHIPDSYEISVGFHSKNPENMAEILNCLTATFIEKSSSEEFSGDNRRIEILKSERTRLKSDLDADLQSRSDIARALGVVSFEQLPAGRAAEASRSALDQARRARVEAEAEVTLLERDTAIMSVPSQAEPIDNPRYDRLRDRHAEIERQMSDLKPVHPDYQRLARELAGLDEQLKAATPKTTRPSQVELPSSQLLIKARIDLERTRKAETELSGELASNLAKLDSTAAEFQRGRDLGSRIELLRTQLTAIDDRLSSMRIEASAPGFLKVVSPARTPLRPAKNSRTKYFGGLIALALCASIFSTILIESAGSKILTAVDVIRIMGFPPLGILLSYEPRSRHFAREQFSRMVNNIERVHRKSGAKVLLFTPVGRRPSEEGLVASIAKDLNARHIRAVVVKGSALKHSSRLTENCMVPVTREVAFETAYEGPGVSSRQAQSMFGVAVDWDGGRPDKPTYYSMSGMTGIIDEMKLVHDVILVEAPPILASAEAEYLTSIAGVTFLTVAAGSVSTRDLKRATALIERLQPAGIAAILHGVSLKSADAPLRRSFREFEACRNRV